MKNQNLFKAKFYYTYIQSGYSEKDFEHLYDFDERIIDCTLELPNSEGKFIIQFDFSTPDGKHNENIKHDLQSIVINGGVKLLFGIHFYNYSIENNQILINGNFIYEFEKEDGFHAYGCKLKIYDHCIIDLFESNHLFYKKDS